MKKKEILEEEKKFFDLKDKILSEAKDRGVEMRILGSIAFRIHCPKFNHILYSEDRTVTDVDFVAHLEDNKKISNIFTSLGWEEDEFVKKMSTTRGNRSIFYSPNGEHSDVFYDKLEMCHTIDLSERLKIDYPTLSPADLLLEKMQIVELNRKDVIDTLMLFREHEVGSGDNETINANYISSLCAGRWGFWKTITENLAKLKKFLPEFKTFEEEDRRNIRTKIDSLLKAIEEKPKTFKWKLRSIIGERKKWYREVEEINR